MKYVKYLVLILVSYTTTLQAQVHQGDWLLGGNFNSRHTKTNDNTYWRVAAQPSVGYFFLDRFVLTGTLRVDYNVQRSPFEAPEKNYRAGLGLMASFYFWKKSSTIQPFVYTDVTKIFSSSVKWQTRYLIGDMDLGLGVQGFIRKDIALEFRQSIFSDRDAIFFNSTLGFKVLLPQKR